MKTIFPYLIVFCIVFGCQKTEEKVESDSKKMMMIKLPTKEKVYEEAAAAVESEDMEAPPPPPTGSEITIEAKIIKNANIRFETSDLNESYTAIQNAVKKHGAIIQNDNEGKDYGTVFRNLVVRIPSKNFDVFISDISKGVSYFDKKEISSDDVTEQYIDIDARLKAKKILEIRYFELLKKASKVSEMIEIETQLATIREEIEAKEGQLRFMQSRVSMSTITIECYKTVAEQEGATESFGSKIWNAIGSGFNSISNFFIGLLQLWPFILIFVLGFYFIRKRIKKKTIKNE
jgi:Domain of unknown function (DUF4349)